MSTPSQRFVQNKFAEYYRQCASEIEPPPSIEQREFGFFLLRERIMLRHKSFRTMEDFRSFVQRITPSDVYYSAAYYERPEAEMDEKGWLGADLIFDIDADHIPTPCNKVHDTWLCGNCGAAGRGVPPATCPSCGGQKFDEKTWPCEVCLNTAKAETIKLMDFLIRDFGFSLDEMQVFFSGHRGYHLQVESEKVRTLDQLARSEMVDYLLGVGLEPQFHGLVETLGGRRSRILIGPDLSDSGWRGRIAKGTYDFLLTASEEELEKIGLKKKAAEAIIKNREKLLMSWRERGPWGVLRGIGIENWKRIVQQGAERQSVKIDTVVTTDIHRLLRFNNTLHGKTALKKTQVSLTSMEDFDPFQNAIAFKRGTVTLLVEEAPEFRLGNMAYGPYKNQKVELSTAAALLLLCKGLAKVAEER